MNINYYMFKLFISFVLILCFLLSSRNRWLYELKRSQYVARRKTEHGKEKRAGHACKVLIWDRITELYSKGSLAKGGGRLGVSALKNVS